MDVIFTYKDPKRVHQYEAYIERLTGHQKCSRPGHEPPARKANSIVYPRLKKLSGPIMHIVFEAYQKHNLPNTLKKKIRLKNQR